MRGCAVSVSVAPVLCALLLGAAITADAASNDFGVDISSLEATPATPIYTATPFYGGEPDSVSDTASVKITTLGQTISFSLVTTGLGSTILAAELFIDGRLYEGQEEFTVRLKDDTTGWTSIGLLVNSSDTAIPLAAGPPLTGRGSQSGNRDNVFLAVGPAFYDGLLASTLQIQIEKTGSNGNPEDYINGVNLQVSSVPEPTSMLLFGTVMAWLGWASRKRFFR